MSWSGPNNTWKVGSWNGLSLPVTSWRVWLIDGTCKDTDWGKIPDSVACVIAIHPNGFKTWMIGCDEYPPPPPFTGKHLLGEQLGEVGSKPWADLRRRIQEVER